MTLPSDANDLAALRGPQAVRELVASAKPVPAGEDAPGVVDLDEERSRKRQAAAEAPDASHHVLAHAWCDARSVQGYRPVYTNGAFRMPGTDALWHRASHEAIQVQVAAMFPGRKLCRKNSDFRQIADHIAALCEVEGFFDDVTPGVVTPAGLYTLTPAGPVALRPLLLADRQAFALPYAPDFGAEAPLLDAVLHDAFEGDDPAGQIDLWWQAVGAAIFGLMPKLQVVLLMLGRERSGKSLLQRILERIFPEAAVGAISPASWGHEYHAAGLADKRLNVVGELADDAPIPAAAFKNVTGQNLVAARHPTHRPFSFRCHAAHVFASNVLPPTTDRSEAFYRRWRVLRFANTVPPERVDPDLCEKIASSEMPAILAQAFLGAERVARAGRIRTTAAHDAVLERWRMAANPLQQFLIDEEWVELDPEARVHTPPEVYEAYRRWASAAGFRNPFGRNHFLELLEATGATRGVQIKRIGTKNVVVGLRLVPKGP